MADSNDDDKSYPKDSSSPIDDNDSINKKNQNVDSPPKKFHHLSVCMVPPESAVNVWKRITKCRTELRDPGLFRWPPHVNLLYPFIGIRGEDDAATNKNEADLPTAIPQELRDSSAVDKDVVNGLIAACREIEPFDVCIHQFGTFGGKQRGVLWLYPDSSSNTTYEGCDDDHQISPLD
jgi:hypothetical protein